MSQEVQPISRPPTSGELFANGTFRALSKMSAWLTILVVVVLIGLIGYQASGAVQKFGHTFFTTTAWDPGKEHYGILAEISGTMYSSILGVALGSIFGVMVAIVLTQDFLPDWLADLLKHTFNLLAAIPSVVYGLWGIFVVIPAIRPASNWVHERFGWIALFDTPLLSVGMLPAALVLAIMVLPTVAAISRDSLAAVNPRLREAAFGLGATHWETIFHVVLPTARRGVWGSVILGFGRAIGETMALAMLVGSTSKMSWSVFAPANTLAALLANKFPEAATEADVSVLMYVALVLLGLTLLVNVLGAWIIGGGRPQIAGAAR
jgi:phosphate transport system permease protein